MFPLAHGPRRRMLGGRLAAGSTARISMLVRTIAAAGLLVGLLAGCRGLLEASPSATPVDFPGIALELAKRGITTGHPISGDAGCSDPNLIPTAISFNAAGLDQTTPVKIYVYIFSSADAYARRRSDVDACARAYVTDAATYSSVDAPPYVASGQGPWAPRFTDQLRAALMAAAGTGY